VVETGHGAQIIRATSSLVALPQDSALVRLPRAARRRRSVRFGERFESHILFYDAFWYGAAGSVMLVGPPPLNLLPDFERAEFVARPSGASLSPTFFVSRSVMTVELHGAPANTETVEMRLAGQGFRITVLPDMAPQFAGSRCLSTMNKDNDLDWISLWADWHARLHGANAILMIDNGSTRYSIEELEQTLAAVPGMRTVTVLSWPYRYGMLDSGVLFHRHWANFVQIAGFAVWLRRFGAEAAGLMNCDIDELVGTENGRSAFDALADSPGGLVNLRGHWVESVADEPAEGRLHFAYRYRLRNPLQALCADKWLLDPRLAWARDSTIVPMMHRIYGVSRPMRARAPELSFWHFRGISTNWKQNRRKAASPHPALHLRLDALDAEIARYAALGGETG
jgi:hypothetical protein